MPTPEALAIAADRAEVQRIVDLYRRQGKRELHVSISRTINMGNYNSLKVEAGLSQDVPFSANVETEYKTLWNTVNREINRAITAFDKTKAKQVAGGK